MTSVGPALRTQWLVATGLGAGLSPVAPGTAGSLVGLALCLGLEFLGGAPAVAIGIIATLLAGLWSAGPVARHLGREDPGPVVIDEVSGQLLALLFLPVSLATYIAGFLLFRIFDIVKPFPARRLESLPGASGIMADDLVAGLYANLVLWLLVRLFPVALGW